jgi:hypothetical protein
VSLKKYVVPFAAGVAVGAALHKYWPELEEAGGPRLRRGLKLGSRLVERARTALWEQGEKLADLVAEIREEEEAAAPPAEPAA